jgi:hypothetical protein
MFLFNKKKEIEKRLLYGPIFCFKQAHACEREGRYTNDDMRGTLSLLPI